MAGYLTNAAFQALTLAPPSFVDDVEVMHPGWLAGQLDYWSRWIDAQLAKRYAVPFADPIPVTVQGWLVQIVTLQLFLKRGVSSTDEQIVMIEAQATAAREDIAKAANSVEGLFDLPQADGSTRVSKGAPLTYSEHSPYTWRELQRENARDE